MDLPQELNFIDKRRAIRMEWERPVRIVQPIQASGKSINVSACGILLRLGKQQPINIGDRISMEIVRADGMAAMQRDGRIVRFDKANGDILVGVDLI